jgi:hypothetical protein
MQFNMLAVIGSTLSAHKKTDSGGQLENKQIFWLPAREVYFC